MPTAQLAPRWRIAVLTAGQIALLAGPTLLAFWSGGYFDTPRAVAGLAVWLLVAIALLAGRPLPRARSAVLALLGLALLGAWTLISMLWAPIVGSAYHSGQRVLLYTGALVAAAMLLRARPALRMAEPALAAGALCVVGYGISERLLPGLLHFQRSTSAFGRLEQPLTYWNSMGEVAALGLVLCTRLAGDEQRPTRLRMAAAGCSAPLGMGLYLSFSRGALFAFAAGVVTLIAAAPQRQQVRGAVVAVLAAALGAVVAAPLHSVTTLAGNLSTREAQGGLALGLLVLVMLAAAVAERVLADRGGKGTLALPRNAAWIALALICVGLAVVLVAGAKERSARPLSVGATRFATLQSNRYAYWRVAWRAFRDEPLRGVGAGGWAVYWLRLRPFQEFAVDAHSLPLQTLAELGLVGLALLAVFLAGIALAAREALRLAPALAAGPLAAFVTFLVHAPLDWDWEMPAVTLIGIALAGALLALADLKLPAASRGRTRPTRI